MLPRVSRNPQLSDRVTALHSAAIDPACNSKPSLASVATNDRASNPDIERFMSKRSKSHTIKIASNHAVYISQPVAVAALINEAGHSVLSVSDNGPGVPSRLQEEVFLPFFTTKPDGTGVGLSFARQVVLLHKGTIGLVDPTLGGATFQIVL